MNNNPFGDIASRGQISVYYPPGLEHTDDCYLVGIESDQYLQKGIKPGFLLLVDRAADIKDGDTVVINNLEERDDDDDDDEDIYVGELMRIAGVIGLVYDHAPKSDYEPLVFMEENVKIQGKVIAFADGRKDKKGAYKLRPFNV